MKVKGSISKSLKGPGTGRMSLIGMPINDSDGNKIGTITKVDIDNNTWYGEISKDAFREELLNDDKKGFSFSTQRKVNRTSKDARSRSY